MTRQTGLALDDPTRPVPTRPTWIHTLGNQAHAEVFDDLPALAARVVQLAEGGTLSLSARAWPAAYPGLGLFFAWSVYRTDYQGAVTWLGSAAVQDTPRETLQAAIIAARAATAGRVAA